MRKKLAISWLLVLAIGVGVIFWRYEWKYSLPTPVPDNYHAVGLGSPVRLPSTAASLFPTDNKPLFLHFFNPDCPCSRFNMPQFRALVQQYGKQARFAIVVMSPDAFTAEELQTKFNLPYPIPVLNDSAIAASCGVYSTPQAVIIDKDQKLFYRGNYNRSRYCSDEKTGFARLALVGLLKNNYSQNFDPLALKAYGCQLPTCNR
ncbi:peroxiredoxin family protein [Puia sp.]|uniref:peroxiredoxin family protein n=1 Tax=Puia sp. TaxID=2045100 RepID=UPI002F41C83B